MSPRAVGGRRLRYDEAPAHVRGWVEQTAGSVRVIAEHAGGMSPGCATSLEAAAGRRYFLKAMGEELNARTVEIFRAEAAVLPLLREVAYRPRLLGFYDEAGWAGLLLEHVEGRYPDLDDADDFAAVEAAVVEQSQELTPPPEGLPVDSTMTGTALKWADRWRDVAAAPSDFLPEWAVARVLDLAARVEALPEQLPSTSLCWSDVRDDNVLIRPDGSAVLLDWGMWSLGPAWLDRSQLAVQMSDPVAAAAWLDTWVDVECDNALTSLLVAFGGSQLWQAQQSWDPTLPSMLDYCREDGHRFLRLAQLRLERSA